MKRPLFTLQYDLPHIEQYSERGVDRGAKLGNADNIEPRLRAYLELLSHINLKQLLDWYEKKKEELSELVMLLPLGCDSPEKVQQLTAGTRCRLIIYARPLHTLRKLDEVLCCLSQCMPQGTYATFHTMTARLHREMIMNRYPWGIAHIVAAWNFVWHRLFPKLRLTHKLYFGITQGKKRIANRVEMLGRVSRAGFEVVDEHFFNGEYFITARKTFDPIDDQAPTGSPLIHLKRVGKGGETIVVHKFRTMYTYSEYLQPYIYHYQNLGQGGKFHDDYRITPYGRLLRRSYLDELPMIWNLIRGDIKLVGVRPLSQHYFGLYSPEMQQMRTQTKPGLLPPFYFETNTPTTLEEVEQSERRYLEAYLQHPFRTDWRYFWGIVGNIMFRHRRSQ